MTATDNPLRHCPKCGSVRVRHSRRKGEYLAIGHRAVLLSRDLLYNIMQLSQVLHGKRCQVLWFMRSATIHELGL